MGVIKLIAIIVAVWFSLDAILFLFMLTGYLFRERPFSRKKENRR